MHVFFLQLLLIHLIRVRKEQSTFDFKVERLEEPDRTNCTFQQENNYHHNHTLWRFVSQTLYTLNNAFSVMTAYYCVLKVDKEQEVG